MSLRNLGRKFKWSLTIMVVVGAFSAVASPASATVKYTPTGNIKATTTGLTLKQNGTNPKTCTRSTAIPGWEEGTFGEMGSFGEVFFSCGGGLTLTMDFASITPGYETATSRFYLQLPNAPIYVPSPYGYYLPKANRPTWVNGSGITNSVLKFEETVIGLGEIGNITATGTLEFTTSSGGLLTLVK
jgi:hypothetical protein